MTNAKIVTVGTVAPEFVLPNPGMSDAGRSDANSHPDVISLRELRQSGHVVLYFMRAFH